MEEFLARISAQDDPPVTPQTVFQALVAWELIREASDGKVPVPAAGTGPDGGVFYAWDVGRHHLELEFIPECPAEWFYRDRETGESWGEDYLAGDPLSPEVIAKLRLVQGG